MLVQIFKKLYYVSDFRLARNQQDYIDRRGVHVVVGHYLGDSVDGGLHSNLSDGKYLL